eukprot:NODE_3_length_80033_cov_0.932970.p6 type:complete len:617 gc:universal NODE_3_length_80033_cov_0.932970:10939-9089(-)
MTNFSECPQCDCDIAIAPSEYCYDIPVFKPNYNQFKHFIKLMEFIDNHYGQFYGLVKIIPPIEYLSQLPEAVALLENISIKNSIEQEIVGHTGLYQLLNIEQESTYSVGEWVDKSFTHPSCPPYFKGSVGKENSLAEKLQNYHKELNTLDASTINDKPHTSIDFDESEIAILEKQFWQTLAYSSGFYGADLSGSLMSDNLPEHWNLRKLPGLLESVDTIIPGVNTPYLYFGMWKSTFAWHLEDMDLYSINFLHLGAPKFWYVIPPNEMQRFETFCSHLFQQDNPQCKEFMRHKKYILSPSILDTNNIKYLKTFQNAGEFIVTFPYSYHSGFNTGFNCAEATNFALERWANSIGEFAKACTCISDSVTLDFVKVFKNKVPYAPRRIRLRLNRDVELLLEDKEEFEELENGKIVCQVCQKIDSILSPMIPLLDSDKKLGYCHIVCAMFTKEVAVAIDERKILSIRSKRFREIPVNLWGLENFVYCELLEKDLLHRVYNLCGLCKSAPGSFTGVTVKCDVTRCQNWMHPICAFEQGLKCYRSIVESSQFLLKLKNLPVKDNISISASLQKAISIPLSNQWWYAHALETEKRLSSFICFCKKHGEVINDNIVQTSKTNWQ